ncbi:MAG: ABC transporter permease, partial [Mesorhizobium sp.]
MSIIEKVNGTAAGKQRTVKQRGLPISVLASVLWIGFIVLVAVFADQIAPYHYTALDLPNRLVAPLRSK